MSDLRADVLATARAMNASGINRGAAGNVNARCSDGFFITPTGMAYDECALEGMVNVGVDTTAIGRRKPSSLFSKGGGLLALAVEFESLCEQYWRVLQLGQPKLLGAEEMARVIEKFQDYGRQPEGRT